ncbi:indoleamine 2,3-dioxygenase 2 [Monodelphis domestica]|uniref:Indoleamine 2,3-dioxygenase 2 n=1 Tax=Monodelphis domestica TaxID=13616 RepID=B3Y9H9_MONDO|nr:indoleamine 2,3-dioxygenase 2 [Monodelphis domestica]BAG68605.1 indoleamine 2,3-dioxygenase 2 [Monodelphis domestica]
METQNMNLKKPMLFTLEKFHISEDYGFILPDPLQELSHYYMPWMEIASNLPLMIENHELRVRVDTMPLLSCHFLKGHREQYLAHLLLSCITMGYVWQEGEKHIPKVLPRNLALPFVEISRTLGLPPILVHSDLVLTNWKKKDPNGPLEIRNLDTIVSFPGGESLKGFVLVTLLVEKAAVPGIKALVKAINAILQSNEDVLLQALQQLRTSIDEMAKALRQMHDYVDPAIFYAVIRIFLSGWQDNPAIPDGLIYEGVSEEPLKYSGGSAAQSTVFHAFDELLGVCHSKESTTFLHRMREYMPPSHRAFLEEIHSAPSLKEFILSSRSCLLHEAYNQCVKALAELRSHHINIVAKYLLTGAAKAKDGGLDCLTGPPQALAEKGTGGTVVFSFLKSVRNTTLEGIID